MSEILEALIEDKEDPHYEENFTVVWLECFKSIKFVDFEILKKNRVIETLAEKFFSLYPV